MRRALFFSCLLLCSATPGFAQSFLLGPPEIVPNTHPGIPTYPYFPDGHIPFLDEGSVHQMYWAGNGSHRTLGSDVMSMGPPGPAVIGAGPPGSFDNAGAWLYSVYRVFGDTLIGFYHAEDREFHCDTSSHFVAWKSIALCRSTDNGLSWEKRGQILTSATPKPCSPQFGGNGDFHVLWDPGHARWVCFYQENYLCMAVSSNPAATPGSWRKYFNGDYTEPGLGGRNSPVPGLEAHRGGNPSIHYNTFLSRWVMVWGTWDGSSPHPRSLWLSSSTDLTSWSPPQILLAAQANDRIWYPTILGTNDVAAGEDAWLLYAYFPDQTNFVRQFLRRPIQFVRTVAVPPEPPTSRLASIFLEPARPNPARNSASLGFTIVAPSRTSLAVYDLSGRLMAQWTEAATPPGRHAVTWDTRGVPSGVYICALTACGATARRRMAVVR